MNVRIDKGNLYFDANIYDLFFAGNESVALLQKEKGFLILPVHSQASGGRLVKMRNSSGDRVVTATDFLEQCGVDYNQVLVCPVSWDSQLSGLFVSLEEQ